MDGRRALEEVIDDDRVAFVRALSDPQQAAQSGAVLLRRLEQDRALARQVRDHRLAAVRTLHDIVDRDQHAADFWAYIVELNERDEAAAEPDEIDMPAEDARRKKHGRPRGRTHTR